MVDLFRLLPLSDNVVTFPLKVEPVETVNICTEMILLE